MQSNPVRFNDPSGHKYCDSENPKDCTRLSNSIEDSLRRNRVRLTGDWKGRENEQLAVLTAVELVGAKFASERGLGESASDAFKAVYGRIRMKWEGDPGMCGSEPAGGGGCTDGAHQIRFWSLSGHLQNDQDRMTKNVVHELGHAYDWTHYDYATKTRASNHMSADFTRDTVLQPNPYGGRPDWQQSDKNTSHEIFADMFIAWTYNAWNTDPANKNVVDDAQNWMGGLVP